MDQRIAATSRARSLRGALRASRKPNPAQPTMRKPRPARRRRRCHAQGAASRSRESETDETAEFEIPRVRVGLNVVIGQHQIAQQPGPRHHQAHSSPLGTAVDTPVHVRFCSSQPRAGDGHAHEDCATRSEQIRARDDNAGEVDDNSAETVRRSRLDGPLARFTPAAQIPRSRRLGERRFESRGTGRCVPAGAGPWRPSRTARRCTGGRAPRRTSAHR